MKNTYIQPETFIKLKELDRALINETKNSLYDFIGINLRFNGFKYDEITPDDCIVFASTGTDGDHFAFDTKEGTIDNLEEAPILFIQPTDSETPVKLVAKNIKDLFSIFLKLKEFYVLERFDWYESEEDYINDYNTNYKEDIEERNKELNYISNRLTQELNISEIDNVFTYIKEIRER
ncbi:hypothetical protein [Cohnella thailandensis]|uniref:SUKH-4 immunity protein n=1 Tax=Cohnella thailandensis TaxID=557557 RepID=A0A841SPT8_9BACL|nr:hypothetical protein [Cohnella thailandensis]MBB6632616.1 hypothetical protein [Cohnella thailandensis]MBP1975698.1 hypothetical protein [Cohnella thailandensis]